MKMLKWVVVAALVGAQAAAPQFAAAQGAPAPAPVEKNWTAPAFKMHAQTLVDEIMASRQDLLSVTLQGTPPGQKGIYTMFAGSFPDRIGKVSSADDVLVITKGVSLVDSRWKKVDDPRKFVVLLPLRDSRAENVGLVVVAFKNPAVAGKSEGDFFLAAAALRDELQKKIPSHAALFDRSNP